MPTLHFPRPSARHGARLLLALVALTLACAPMMARADDDDDDDDYRPRREYKEKYWDGACKVERKWKRNGEYRESANARATGPAMTMAMRSQPWCR